MPGDQIPAGAITAGARVIHSLTCGECDYPPGDLTVVSSRDREEASKVLAAALPAITARIADDLTGQFQAILADHRAEAAAAERERIRGALAGIKTMDVGGVFVIRLGDLHDLLRGES
jgi:hypothetical protein